MKADAAALVEVRGISKRYGRTLALDDVSLDIMRGERYAVLGPNGAGKTTLIHILCTILQADRGSATIDGHEVRRDPRRARQRLGVVFQEPSVDTRLTVQENLDFHGRIFGVPAALRRRRIDELLELVELGDWRGHLVRALSKGMQRRLEIARALVHDAALLVLDEATAGLDAQSRSRMWEYLGELQRRRSITVLMTTHYIEEADTCERVCVIDHGQVLTVGSPGELKQRHGRMQVRLRPRDEATTADLLTALPESVLVGDSLVVPVADEAAIERLLAEQGPRLRAFSVERPTLESVFLDLTGRALRDGPGTARDTILAAPRSGGEPVR
jgi:ABC-2 type transport system ATP-binding protein